MIIFPAIDIQDGECVRLTKGDFATAERVAEDPVETALAFKEAGAEWLHMVDLDGAKTAQMQNREVFISVAKATEMKIELGGGIRDMKTASYYLENGIERIIIGSLAVRNPKLVAEMVREYGDRIIVGIDAENGMVKIDGWLGSGRVNFLTLAREMAHIGVHHVIYTDISRDGTLTGPNLVDMQRLRAFAGMNVIASGGIRNLADIQALANLRIYGAVCGKSLYKQTLDLKEALAVGSASIPVTIPEEVPEMEVASPTRPPLPQRSAQRPFPGSRKDAPGRPAPDNRGQSDNKGQPGNRGAVPQGNGKPPQSSRPNFRAPGEGREVLNTRDGKDTKPGSRPQNGKPGDGRPRDNQRPSRTNPRLEVEPRENDFRVGGRPQENRPKPRSGPPKKNGPRPGGQRPAGAGSSGTNLNAGSTGDKKQTDPK